MDHDSTVPAGAVRVLPGDYCATREDIAIVTVLGSCVAACLRDPVNGVGGMNHFMLPRERGAPAFASRSARYGVNAMELLINELVGLGARRSRLEAKVFGGGSVVAGITALNVGESNAEFVTQFLHAESIPVAVSDLQGSMSRKVCFFPASGRVMVRALPSALQREVATREARYASRLAELPEGGEVELFR